MNYLLSLPQKYFISIIFFIIVISIFFFAFKTIELNSELNNASKIQISKADITKPKFTINNLNQQISITANEGNFINDEEILLKKDVIFKSKKFTIHSDHVIFNKNNQTASSKKKSEFISNKTSILASGFEISDKGNKITFNGKTTINLK